MASYGQYYALHAAGEHDKAAAVMEHLRRQEREQHDLDQQARAAAKEKDQRCSEWVQALCAQLRAGRELDVADLEHHRHCLGDKRNAREVVECVLQCEPPARLIEQLYDCGGMCVDVVLVRDEWQCYETCVYDLTHAVERGCAVHVVAAMAKWCNVDIRSSVDGLEEHSALEYALMEENSEFPVQLVDALFWAGSSYQRPLAVHCDIGGTTTLLQWAEKQGSGERAARHLVALHARREMCRQGVLLLLMANKFNPCNGQGSPLALLPRDVALIVARKVWQQRKL